jgi:hypothetical protein
MRFLFIGSRFTLHASFPRSVTLTQLRFALLTVTSLQRDLHPQVCAHAGRTNEKTLRRGFFVFSTEVEIWLRGPDLNQRPLGYEPNELPDCSTPRYLRIIPYSAAVSAEESARSTNSTKAIGALSPTR